jgi:hypothetical protein
MAGRNSGRFGMGWQVRAAAWLILASTAVGCVVVDSSSGSGCDPENCAGCCSDGVCVDGSANTACGFGGQTCDVCSMAESCVAGVCAVDPESVWVVQPSSAVIAPSDNGEVWDSDGSPPDVTAEVWCPPGSASSYGKSSESQSFTPAWGNGGCKAKAKHLLSEPVLFRLYDVDILTGDEITGQQAVQLLPTDFSTGGFALTGVGGMQSISFSVYPY